MVATTNDTVPMVNILPFGTCKMKPSIIGFQACVPAPTVWTGFVSSVQVVSGNPLLETSTIQCAIGGCISFQNSGQMKPQKVETNPNSPQIDALRRAAKEGIPFCEIYEKIDKNAKKEIIHICCITYDGRERTLDKLPIGEEFSLCIETKGMEEGEEVNIEIEDADGRTYKNGEKIIKLKGIVEMDGTAYIDNIKLEFT
jgi:hypothetical protein